MSKESKSSHTVAIIVTTVVLLPVLYLGLLFGYMSYAARHEPSPALKRAFESLTAPLLDAVGLPLIQIWASIDANGANHPTRPIRRSIRGRSL